jgi:PAS domain S-box-containing protein
MMRKRTNFIKLIKLWGIIFLLGMGVSIVVIDVIGSHRDFNFRADQMRADYIARQKQIIKQEVNRVVDLISYEKAQSEILTRSKIKSRGYEAYSIAQNIYQHNKTAKSEAEIQQMILDALRPIRFEYGSGYYFATRLDGVEMLFADKPEMEGLNLLDVQDTRDQYVIKDMVEIAKQSGEGFYEYHWTKPDSVGNDFKKISFIKRFEPYDWFIGTGLYVDDVEGHIKANLLSTISRIRFGKEGYIFINRLNGDALVSNGKLFSGTKKLWEVFNKNPEKMKDIFDKEYNAALKPEGDYIYYSHIKLTTPNKESPKASFIYGIPDLQWLVGAGVYLDDVETDIALMQTKLNNQIKKKMLYFILIVMGIVALFFLFFNWLNRGLKNDFNLFISFFNRAARSDEEIDRETIKFVELDQMAEYANKMLADRKQAEDALRESEEHFRLLTEASFEGIVIHDKGKILLANDRYYELFGYEPDELAGKDAISLTATPDSVRRIRECIAEGNPGPYEVTGKKKDGTIFPMEIWSKMFQYQGQTARMSAIRDITEKKKLEGQLHHVLKMESIGTLAGGIAHDFNNIIGIILGNTELAMDDVPEWNPARLNLEEILTACLRAKDVVRQLLSFARKTKLEKKPTNILPIVKDSLKLLRSSIPTSIELRQNIAKNVDTILADPTQINQVLINLCTNADHAMPDGGVIVVTLKNVELDEDTAAQYTDLNPGRYVNLAVSDTGHGISLEEFDRIFDPYFTTKELGKGTGMGLAVVHGIVKGHNGLITVESELGKGTTFSIFFPAVKKEAIVETKTGEKLPTGGERILFVDDEVSLVKMGQQRLERLGYKVEATTSPIEALELFRSKPAQFDLVITDLTMPKMTGDKLVKEILNIRPDIPIILCTGFSDKIDEKKATAIGAADYIEKPLDKREFAFIIRKVLDIK